MALQDSAGTVYASTISPTALSSMFQAISGLRNLRAALAMIVCFMLALLIGWALMALLPRSIWGGLVGGMLGGLLMFAGIHASGVLLMDQARGLPMRSITDAVVYALLCVPKTIVLVIALVLGVVLVYALLAVLFFISKFPGIGPLFFAIAFPVSVLVAGLTLSALLLSLLISLAAFWEGASIGGALAKAFVVLRMRLVETVLLSAVVAVLALIVAGFVGAVLGVGLVPAAAMSALVLGIAPDGMGSLGDFITSLRGGGGLGGHALAGILGAGVLWALALTLSLQVMLMGINLIYLRVTEGLDASATEDAIQAKVAEARRMAAEVKHRAKEAGERARASAEHARDDRRSTQTANPIASTAMVGGDHELSVQSSQLHLAPLVNCPACRAAVTAHDTFCGHCGHRLHAST